MSRYALNTRDMVAKTVDDETVLINLSTGAYYSIAGAGSVVFEYLAAGHAQEEIAPAVADGLGVNGATVAGDLERFVAELLEQDVLVTAPGTGGLAEAIDPSRLAVVQDGYTAPRLEVYTDMADLLALDPPMPGLQDIPWEPPAR
jgi:hypothetical protein